MKKLVGKFLYLDKSKLPILDRKQFYYNDLINLNVFIKKKNIGKVLNVKNHGAGDYLEISDIKNELLVPFNNDHILEIDLKNRKILLNPQYYEI